MKNKDLKKGKESIIGKIIYGFLLFMPLIAIGVTCLVNTFNQQARQESNIVYAYETNNVTTINDLVDGNIYTYNVSDFATTFPSGSNYFLGNFYAIEFLEFNYSEFDINQRNQLNHYGITINRTNNNIYIASFENNVYKTQITIPTGNLNDNSLVFNFVYKDSFNNDYINYVSKCDNIAIKSVEQKDISNIFYYAIDKVEQSSLFNWAQNSLIYTGIADTCTQLSITNTFIPLLLAYWLIISVIYILYDIILMILIILHNKIHQIQDSI